MTTVDNVLKLVPEIADRAGEIEQARDVPLDLVEKLRSAGVFSRYVPRSHGGQELWPEEAIQTIEELGRADGSVAWIALVGSEGPVFYSYLPAETYDSIYASGPNVIHAGSISASRGKAIPEGDGYRYSGTWGFASGCTHADAICIVGTVPTEDDDARPRQLSAFVDPADLTIVDNWFVNGLKGTASRDLEVEDLFVDEAWTGCFQDPPQVRHPLDSLPFLGRFGIEHAAMALGVAQGAMDDIIEIAGNKKPLQGQQARLASDPVLQHLIGNLSSDLDMARALLYQVARWDKDAAEGANYDTGQTFIRRARLARVAGVSAAVVEGCYRASGTTGLLESSPLGRRMRDVHGATQHFLLSERNAFAPAGAAVLGESGS